MASRHWTIGVALWIGIWLMAATAWAGETWTLARVVEQVLSDSPDARIASQRIAAARAGLQQARSAYWPRLQLESSYSLTNNPVMAFGAILNQQAFSSDLNFNDVPAVDNFNIRGTVSVPLFAGGGNLAANDSASAQAQAAEQQAQAIRRSLEFEAARAYYSVIKMRNFERAAESAVGALEQNRDIARKRFGAGALLKADVLQVEVRLAQAKEDLVRARNARRLAQHALRNLIGIERGELQIDESLPKSPPAAAPQRADFSQRTELAAARQQIRGAQAAVRRAKGGYWPRLDAVASLAYDAGLELEGDNLSYMAGVQLRWQLWDGFDTRGRVAQARAGLQTAREQQRKLRLALDLELTRARIRLQEATERLEVTAASITQAEQSVKLTRARFEQGLALATQLLDAETALTAARVRRADSEADKLIAVAALRKALGLPQIDSHSPSTKDGAQ